MTCSANGWNLNQEQAMSDDVNKPEQQPLTPLDFALAKIEHWVEQREIAHAEAEEQASIPDDIPLFVTS